MAKWSNASAVLFAGLVLLSTVASMTEESDEHSDNNRESKFFNLFSIVSFKNDYCNSTGDQTGTCYTSRECSDIDGTAEGNCAAGFGVCCVTKGVCGGSTSLNNTYFTNPGYSGTYSTSGMCDFTVNKCTPNICQLRLEFEDFELSGPTSIAATTDVGNCNVDYFTVTGGDANSAHGPICGSNSGQHIIVHAGSGSTCVLKNVLGTASTTARKWKIKIIQVPCNSRTLAPSGCNQYFIGHSGVLESFNYGADNVHLQSQNQAACIRPEEGFCTIAYKNNPSAATDPFSTDEGTDNQALQFISCTKDYVIIPFGRVDGAGQPVDRFCGEGLTVAQGGTVTVTDALQPVTSVIRPFTFTFISNAEDPTDALTNPNLKGQLGFSIAYEQEPC